MKNLFIFLIMCALRVQGQEVLPLYEGTIPFNKPEVKASLDSEIREGGKSDKDILRLRNITMPSITVYRPVKPNGTAVVICPGGGYWILAASHEGADVAKKLGEMGVTAFVLKYRLPSTDIYTDKEVVALADAQQAIRMVRGKAESFGIKPDRIGIMGFSAGGHLASTAATHFDRPVLVSEVSARPDFAILGYPVISFDASITHKGSCEALLGKNPSPEKLDYYSNDKQVSPQTPPTFLVHAANDGGVPVENSMQFALACKKNNVPVELHIYPKGGHGFGMNNPSTNDQWIDRLKNWLETLGK